MSLTLGDFPTPPDGVKPSTYLWYMTARVYMHQARKDFCNAVKTLLENGSARNIEAADAAQVNLESAEANMEQARDAIRREMRRVRG